MRLAILLGLLALTLGCQQAGNITADPDQIPPGQVQLVQLASDYMGCSLAEYTALRQDAPESAPAEPAAELAQALCGQELDAYQDYLQAEMNAEFAARETGNLVEYTRERLLESGL